MDRLTENAFIYIFMSFQQRHSSRSPVSFLMRISGKFPLEMLAACEIQSVSLVKMIEWAILV